MDERLRDAFAAAGGLRLDGLALVAVGGYGRAEMSPASDVDVLLVHDDGHPGGSARLADITDALWYPLWDDGVPLDHAVREADAMVAAAVDDLRVAMGMLDARHVAGDERLTSRVRSQVLGEWRRTAAQRLPDLRAACAARAERAGDVAHAAVPDLKESRGGLRDGVVLRALVATWLIDVPHREVEGYRATLLDVRDTLHEVSGRRSDRLVPDRVADIAARLGQEPHLLTFRLRDSGRRTAHLLDSAWRRLDPVVGAATATSPPRGSGRRPDVRLLAPGVGRLGDEVVLTAAADPTTDPLLALRAAALAAEQGLLLSRASADRLGGSACALPVPWPPAARRWLVRLLAAGPGLLPVWEELDQAGVVDQWLPEWGRVRLLSSTAVVHRWTVDRHSVQTAVNAAARLRRVSRPDLLVVAALLHDIGKGCPVDHSALGARLARGVCLRWGFDAADAETVALLVRHHLLLPTVATRRDLDDPATIAAVTGVVRDAATLDLLTVLTESDAEATGTAAWTRWRAGLVHQLADTARHRLLPADAPVVPTPQYQGGAALGAEPFRVEVVAQDEEETRLLILAPDRLGLLADIAGALTLAGLPVRGASAWTGTDGVAVSRWDVPAADVDMTRLGIRYRQLLEGSGELRHRLDATAASRGVPPVARAPAGASSSATVVEVRAGDRRGLVWAVCDIFARHGVNVRTAHLDTLGPQTYDVFYLVGPAGQPLPDPLTAAVVADIQRL